ncbi:AvrD family protein [Streptomyces pseudovenezuelae]|uniref:AvrD family protein n=1 Tax=Streptomyces pseudovenezuelae TaxID=67350 RepID=UPI0034A11032
MPILEFASIDDVLGPREGRFLGEGFKRVERSLRDLTVSPGDEGVGGIEATARVATPGVWSRKGRRQPKPHLSTIDAMLFAAQLTGLYAAHTFQLAPGSRFTVQSVELKAGSRPDEDALENLPVSGRLVGAHRSGDERTTTLECRIGSLSARVRAGHGAGRAQARTSGMYHLPEELPGPWNNAPFGVRHDARRQLLTGVRVDADDVRACARVTLAPHRTAALPPAAPASVIDAFVAAMQLGQALLYTLDDIDRAQSNNLWMRRTRITADVAPDRLDDEVNVLLEGAMLLPSSDGTWRSAEVVGSLHGVRTRAGVAHLLPRSAALAAPSPRRKS